MPVTPPTAYELARIAEQYGLSVQPQDLESYRVLATRLLASYNDVELLYAAGLPEPPQRPTSGRPKAATTWAPGTSPPTSPPVRTGRWPAAGLRSRTISPWPAFR